MPVVAFCTECGSPRGPDDVFCAECGQRLITADPAPATVGPSGSSAAGPSSPPEPAPPATTSVPPPAPARARLPLRDLLPTSHLQDVDWRRPWVVLFLVAALAPFVLLQISGNGGDLHTAAIGFAAYFGLAWAVALYIIVRPGSLPWALLAKVGGFTLIVGVWLASSLEKQLGADTSSWISAILTVGLPEELAKALAVFLFLNLGRVHYSIRTYLFVGAFSGLVFGTAEAVSYSGVYAELLQLTGAGPGVVIATLWRLLSDGLFHGTMAGITALFLGLARANRVVGTQLAVLGLALAAVLHGTYDWSASNWFGTAIAVVIVMSFLAYVRSADTIGAVLEPLQVAAAADGAPSGGAGGPLAGWSLATTTPGPPQPGWSPEWEQPAQPTSAPPPN